MEDLIFDMTFDFLTLARFKLEMSIKDLIPKMLLPGFRRVFGFKESFAPEPCCIAWMSGYGVWLRAFRVVYCLGLQR